MPREIKNLKEFLSICARRDARCVKVKTNPTATKFKVRCSKFLYTLVVEDKKRAQKIEKSIHPNVKKVHITTKQQRRSAATKSSK